MTEHATTRHAETRQRQRGLRDADLGLVLATASQVAVDAYLMTDADVAREVAQRKNEIQRLERLRGVKVVVCDDVIVTVVRSRRDDQRRVLRRGRAGG
jgi:hypothetical protein